MRLLAILLLLFIISSSFFCQGFTIAQDNNLATEQSLLKKIELLYDNAAESPQEKLEELTPIIKICSQNNWEWVCLQARILKVELLLDTDSINKAEEIFKQLIITSEQEYEPKTSIRLALIQLHINDVKGLANNTKKQHRSLLAKASKIESPKLAGLVYLNVGVSQYDSSDNLGALKTLKKAYTAYELAGDVTGIGSVFNALANVNNELQNTDIALEYLQKSLALSRKVNNEFGESIVLYNIGNTYSNNGDIKKAKKYMQLAIKMSLKLNDKIGVSWAKKQIADLSLQEKNWQGAIELYNEVESNFIKSGSIMPLFEVLSGQAKAYIALKNIERAKQKADESQLLLEKLKIPYYKLELNEIYADIAYSEGEYQKGYDILKENYEFANELHIKQKQESVEKYRVQFDSELKEKENQTLLAENNLKNLFIEQQVTQQRLWWLIAAFICLLLVTVGIMLFIQTKNRNHFKSIALKDHLTNSPNRRAILQHAESRFFESTRTAQRLTVSIIDIDNFKLLNDHNGHKVGDEILIAFAAACKETLRQYDKFGRFGGEEWLCVYINTSPEDISAIFIRLRDEFNRVIQQKYYNFNQVTFSMGVATFNPETDKTLLNLINRADKNLYKAKKLGKNQVSF